MLSRRVKWLRYCGRCNRYRGPEGTPRGRPTGRDRFLPPLSMPSHGFKTSKSGAECPSSAVVTPNRLAVSARGHPECWRLRASTRRPRVCGIASASKRPRPTSRSTWYRNSSGTPTSPRRGFMSRGRVSRRFEHPRSHASSYLGVPSTFGLLNRVFVNLNRSVLS
jgi:hypothetical protein